MREKKGQSKTKNILRIIVLIIISVTLGLMMYGWNARTMAGNAMPMPFGVGASVVLTGSMHPTLSKNDFVIVLKQSEYKVDDVVVYQDGRSLVIHRIISIDGDEVITQGDANNTHDDAISLSDIKGKAVIYIPYVGAAILFLKTPIGSLLLIIAAIALFEMPHLLEKKKAEDEKERIREEIRKLKGE